MLEQHQLSLFHPPARLTLQPGVRGEWRARAGRHRELYLGSSGMGTACLHCLGLLGGEQAVRSQGRKAKLVPDTGRQWWAFLPPPQSFSSR